MHELIALIHDEFRAKQDDDLCTAEDLRALRTRFEELQAAGSLEEFEALYEELQAVPARIAEERQPSDLEGIRRERGEGPRSYSTRLTEDVVYSKILGGLLGRAAGCTLGKPVEGWSRAEIESYLRGLWERDIDDYIPFSATVPPGATRTVPEREMSSCRGHIRYAPRDDDMDYTVLGIHVVKSVGKDFTAEHVVKNWISKLPYSLTYTAERVAYRNIINGFKAPETATYRNPYREWIGAQIRADGYGYVAPGHPELAAELAWRDASVSHVKNGIYGAMWVAAAIAAAFVTDDLHEVITVATSEIPKQSRFAAMVEDVLNWSERYSDWRDCWTQIAAKYGHLHPVHTINNAALVLLGLLYGERDLGKTIGIAVQGGWDTDCNGATAGSILGVMLGADALPRRWIDPLNDTLHTAVMGYSVVRFTELAKLATELALDVTGS